MGAPVGLSTAEGLEKAIKESISLQPYVRSVEVRIDRGMIEENAFGYSELQGRMIFAEVEIEYEGESVRARLEYDPVLKYPLMRLF